MQKELYLGNLASLRDWGYAPEYVEAMWMILQVEQPGDFVIATGECHSVEEFCALAFDHVGLDWKKYVKTDRRYKRPLEVNALLGDPGKAKNVLKWEPKTRFKELVKIMIDADLSRWKRYKGGEIFPWDAPNFPDAIGLRYLTRAIRA